MGASDRADWLDEVIVRAAPAAPTPDYEAWRAAHPEALEALKRSTPRKAQSGGGPAVIELGRYIMRSPIAKLAVAALLIAGTVVLSRYLIGRDRAPGESGPTVVETVPSVEQNDADRELEAIQKELALAKALFAEGDVAGLLALLETGQAETRLAVAQYLAAIGDASALPALERVAEQWEGAPGNNPFQKACEAIRARLPEPEPADANAVEPNVPSAPVAAEAEPQTGVAGVVVDKLTQKPIEGALVGNKSSDRTAAVPTDAAGRFVLTGMRASQRSFVYVTATGYSSERIITTVVQDRITDGVRIELGPGSRIEGTVTDPDGRPIAGAEVETFHFTNYPAVTGADGRYEIDGLNPVVNSYSLHATHPNYPAVSLQFAPAAVGGAVIQDIVLKPGTDVFGRVTDSAGRPVEGVQVGNTTSRAMWNCITAKTDAQGRYRLENVDRGALVLWAVHGTRGLCVHRTTIGKDAAEMEVDLQLAEPTPLQGRVVDQAGQPVPGVQVVIEEYEGVRNLARKRYTTDDDGGFTIANAPTSGELNLWVFGGGISAVSHTVDFDQEQTVIAVTRAGRIYGQVLDAAGAPIPEFIVKMTFSEVGESPSGYAATWNREGHSFRSSHGLFDTGSEDLPVGGPYRMTVFAEGYDALTLDPVIVQPISEDPNRTVFRLATATLLAGVAVDERGAPVRDAAVALFAKPERHEPRHWRRFTTDGDGVFVVAGVGREQRYMYVTAPGFAPHYGLKQDLETTDEAPARIVLRTGATLFGTVVDERGRPAPGLTVNVQKRQDRSARLADYPYPVMNRSTKTDRNGYYELSGLPSGRCYVHIASNAGDTLAGKHPTLSAGESTQLDFGNEEGFTVTGVLRRGATPIADADIALYFSESNSDSKHALTDEQGRFRLVGVPSGRTRLIISWADQEKWRSNGRRSSDRREIRIDDDTELDLDLGGGTITAEIPRSVRGRDGLKVSVRRRLTVPSVEGRYWENAHRANRIGAIGTDGCYECRSVRAGEYYLVLSDTDHVLGISDVFTLADGEHRQGIEFRLGQGRLSITAVDAQTGQGIAEAHYLVENDLEWSFWDRRPRPGRDGPGLVTDAQGRAVHTDLPAGRYQVSCRAEGYLWATSDFVEVAGDGTASVTVPLQPAAMASFELSPKLQDLIDTDSVQIQCRVIDLDTQTPVPVVYGAHTSEIHNVSFSLDEPGAGAWARLHLPEGRYRLEYAVRPYNTTKRVVEMSVHEGTVTVELKTGQVTPVLLDK